MLKDIEQNTKKQRLTFYKPFYNKNKNLIHIVCFNLEESNKENFVYKTLYQLSNSGKIKKIFWTTIKQYSLFRQVVIREVVGQSPKLTTNVEDFSFDKKSLLQKLFFVKKNN